MHGSQIKTEIPKQFEGPAKEYLHEADLSFECQPAEGDQLLFTIDVPYEKLGALYQFGLDMGPWIYGLFLPKRKT